MRTTIHIDDRLLKEAKQYAAENGATFTRLVSDALREKLARHRARRKDEPAILPTFKGEGLQAGVDLDDTSALLDLMVSPDAPC